MFPTPQLDRRSILAALAAMGTGLAGLALGGCGREAGPAPPLDWRSGLRQSMCRWCVPGMPLETLATTMKGLGYGSIELLDATQARAVKNLGMGCAVLNSPGVSIADGLNRVENHGRILAGLRQAIDAAADLGVPNVITFAGNRKGLSDDEGAAHCIAGLKQVAGHAEAKGVTIVMELLNSRIEHKDHMADHSAFGVRVCQGVGSPRVKLLFDCYHMQVMEGDLIATLRRHIDLVGHIHVAGVPGRHEPDATQELNYPAIIRALAASGYQGWIGHEFQPTGDPVQAFAASLRICGG